MSALDRVLIMRRRAIVTRLSVRTLPHILVHCDNSGTMGSLSSLEDAGMRLILCSTCPNLDAATHQMQVGIAGSVADHPAARSHVCNVSSLCVPDL